MNSYTPFAAFVFLAASIVAQAETVTAPEVPFLMPDIAVWHAPERNFTITDYGAEAGGTNSCAPAINAAVAAASAAGGGRVVIPDGEWFTGAIHLKSNVELHLADNAKVVFSDDPADYLPAVQTTWEGVEVINYSPLVRAFCCTNVAITGKGTFAPKMDRWRTWFKQTKEHMYYTQCLYNWCTDVTPVAERRALDIHGSNARPHFIQFNRCANITLDGFKIRESPFWTIHLFHSENAVVRNLDVYAHGFNNDGIDIEMTKNVIVEDCKFDQGDDGVVIKSGRNQSAWALNRPTENVVVRNCEIVNGHGLLVVGSEISGGVRNVYMHDCHVSSNVINGFYVKTNERRGGFVENIYMKDCSVKSASRGLVSIETDVLYHWRKYRTREVRLTPFRNFVIENVTCDEADHLLMCYGDARLPVESVTMKNVNCGKTRKERIVCRNANGVTLDGEPIPSSPGPAIRR